MMFERLRVGTWDVQVNRYYRRKGLSNQGAHRAYCMLTFDYVFFCDSRRPEVRFSLGVIGVLQSWMSPRPVTTGFCTIWCAKRFFPDPRSCCDDFFSSLMEFDVHGIRFVGAWTALYVSGLESVRGYLLNHTSSVEVQGLSTWVPSCKLFFFCSRCAWIN